MSFTKQRQLGQNLSHPTAVFERYDPDRGDLLVERRVDLVYRHVRDAGELEQARDLAELGLIVDCQDDRVRASWNWDCCAFARGVNDLGG